jgi:hypothetical protein
MGAIDCEVACVVELRSLVNKFTGYVIELDYANIAGCIRCSEEVIAADRDPNTVHQEFTCR